MKSLILARSAWLHLKFALTAHEDERFEHAERLFHKACDLELLSNGCSPVFLGEESRNLARLILENNRKNSMEDKWWHAQPWRRIEAVVNEDKPITVGGMDVTPHVGVHVG